MTFVARGGSGGGCVICGKSLCGLTLHSKEEITVWTNGVPYAAATIKQLREDNEILRVKAQGGLFLTAERLAEARKDLAELRKLVESLFHLGAGMWTSPRMNPIRAWLDKNSVPPGEFTRRHEECVAKDASEFEETDFSIGEVP